MSSIVTTTCDIGSIIRRGSETRDEGLTLAAAGTVVAGTILARDSLSKKLVLFVKGGTTNQNGIARAVMGYDFTAPSSGDFIVCALERGHVQRGRLVIAADGNGTNVDDVVLDQLRSIGIMPIDVQQLSV